MAFWQLHLKCGLPYFFSAYRNTLLPEAVWNPQQLGSEKGSLPPIAQGEFCKLPLGRAAPGQRDRVLLVRRELGFLVKAL